MDTRLAFSLAEIRQYYGPPVTVSRPKEFTCFSYDEEHVLYADDRSLRYFYPPSLGTNLCEGFESFKSLSDDTDEHLDGLLIALAGYEKSKSVTHSADVITWRGILTKIMTSPFDDSGFEMNAVKFQGSIFLEENHEFKLGSRVKQFNQHAPMRFPSQEMMSYWGYKFETISTIPAQWDETSREIIEGREFQQVQNLAQYCSIVDTKIGETSLVLGGEVDAVWDQKPSGVEEPIRWVELKTTALIENERDMAKYERKLLKFWAQSFLLGVPKIIVGVRSKSGVLLSLEEIETQKIPAFVKAAGKSSHRKPHWDASVCLNFTGEFLKWLKSSVDGPCVWRIRRADKSSNIELFSMKGTSAESVLNADFIKWRQQQQEDS